MSWTVNWQAFLSPLIPSAITFVVTKQLESIRRIQLTVTDLYYGPSLTYNCFMGRNYPADDSIEFIADVAFFSSKSMPVGLLNFYLEFTNSTRFYEEPEMVIPASKFVPDFDQTNVVHRLDTLVLPSHEFIKANIQVFFDREQWKELEQCRYAYLACTTPDGRRKRFMISRLTFPEMPPEGIRGISISQVQVELSTLHQRRIVITASRVPNPENGVMHFDREREKMYWTGSEWTHSEEAAETYDSPIEARKCGERIKIWNIVPEAWLEANKRS